MATLQELGAAIAQQKPPPRQVFCGFDLWLEVLGSGKLKMAHIDDIGGDRDCSFADT